MNKSDLKIMWKNNHNLGLYVSVPKMERTK